MAGNTVTRLISAAGSVNATLVKASAGTVVRVIGYNAKASAVYLKLYNKATAPTVGTDTPAMTIYLPASGAFSIPVDCFFWTGIGFGLTTDNADNGTTALSSGDILGLNIITA